MKEKKRRPKGNDDQEAEKSRWEVGIATLKIKGNEKQEDNIQRIGW